MKKKNIVFTSLIFVLIMGIVVGLNMLVVNASSNSDDDFYKSISNEAIAYAAALSTLPENNDNDKTENINIAKAYIKEENTLNKEFEAYAQKHEAEYNAAQESYDIAMKEHRGNAEPFTLDDLSAKDRKMIKANNENSGTYYAELTQLEKKYEINKLPILFYTIDEVLGGIEDGLLYKGMIAEMVRERGYLEAEGYSMDDFEAKYTESIAAEAAVRDKINADPNPDLYTYSVMLYQAREDFPVIF